MSITNAEGRAKHQVLGHPCLHHLIPEIMQVLVSIGAKGQSLKKSFVIMFQVL
jgi:hypothetical protein